MTKTTRPDWLLPPVESLTEFPTQQIARQLSRICRYAGATPHFYSVARHSLLVAELVPDEPALKLAALVHDAHECWTGDVLRPAKQRVGFALDDLTRAMDEKLHALLWLDLSLADKHIVQMADDAACQLEMAWIGKPAEEISLTRPGKAMQNGLLSMETRMTTDEQVWATVVREWVAEVLATSGINLAELNKA